MEQAAAARAARANQLRGADAEAGAEAAAATDGDAGGVEPKAVGELLEFADPPPLGACQVLVHIIDARDLGARDANNSSDPVVKVFCAY